MLIACVLVLALALATTAAATPIVRSIALYRDLIDRPNHRKVHTDGVPRLGGLALGAGIFAAIGLVVLLVPEAHALIATRGARLASLLVGCSILGLVGFLDDLRGLGARPKLVAQIVAGLVAFAGGNQFRFFEGAIVGSSVGLVLNLIATVVWVVAITNAMNLIDGLDGLATGITTIAVTALGVISLAHGHPATALLAAAVAGAALGFLPYNVHPARIFLGDSGSFLLGYLLATISMQGMQEHSTWSTLVVLFFLFSVPLLDTSLAIVRRALRGQDLFTADGNHIHHRLLRRGFGHLRSVLMLWGTTLLFGTVALLLGLVPEGRYVGLLRLSGFVVLLAAASRLGALEVRDLLHVLRGSERRRLSPRDRNLAVRRALKDLPAHRDGGALGERLIGLAREIDLDLLRVEVEMPGASGARPVAVIHWIRDDGADPGQGTADGAPIGRGPIAVASAEVGATGGVRGLVVLGKQDWKLRRRSEDHRAWAHQLAEGLGALDSSLRALAARPASAAEHRVDAIAPLAAASAVRTVPGDERAPALAGSAPRGDRL
jgi:UDP-GlcNAc:undecaprenyl-phosphate GlcNAc-1-phosphate transferase